MEDNIFEEKADGELSDTSSVLSDVDSELFKDFDIDGSNASEPDTHETLFCGAAEMSDTTSILSDVPSEIFADFDLDGSFLESCSEALKYNPLTKPSQRGRRKHAGSQNISQTSYQLNIFVSNHRISLGTLSTDYQRSMSEASSTIIVDTSTQAPHPPKMSRRGRSSSDGEKESPDRRITSANKAPPAKEHTPSKRLMLPLDTNQNVTVVREDTETETEEEHQPPTRKICSRTRKRKRVSHADEDYDPDDRMSMNIYSRVEEEMNRSKVKKRSVKTREPAMGKFKVSRKTCTKATPSSSQDDAEAILKSAEAEQEDDLWEAEPFQKEYEEATVAKMREAHQLNSITEFPPPSGWYAGVPKANSQWTVCVRPPKPTWYHPDWDAERRKQADKATAALVRQGEEVLEADMENKRYRMRKSGTNLVTKHTVTWYQCHWFPTGKRWVFNISLDGYDEY
ncbi:hypothetical protein ONS95_011551 [Cadophora gregata]|uniref:uncharacterized protein n=1 Tax=Cadophora gregata TaxID=51156 RepID=UPI0026DCF4E8|nr:uncharacterized protein ONS95_011551 [Cadophora gregata]KAK0120144.1 hypothetical protein ONS95_011551 [Cadophora gregata]